MTSLARRRALLLCSATALGALVLAGCSAGSSTTTAMSSSSGAGSASASAQPSESASPAPSVTAATAPVRQTKVGVSATGNLGDKPALTVPTTAAPTALSSEVLAPGTGAEVHKGDTLVVNYLGETWALKDGKPNIFDNSYDRKAPSAFPIGVGEVIKGWDETLVGTKVGSRVLISVPPDKGYKDAGASNPLADQTLLFVVDVLGAYDKTAAATGTAVKSVPAGFPAVTSESGKQPSITSVTGVTVPTDKPTSALLLAGAGAPLDPTKSLVLQIVQTDAATGKQTTQSWGQKLELVPAQNVFQVASALQGQKVGSRVVAVTPKSGNDPAFVLVIDVVAQF